MDVGCDTGEEGNGHIAFRILGYWDTITKTQTANDEALFQRHDTYGHQTSM